MCVCYSERKSACYDDDEADLFIEVDCINVEPVLGPVPQGLSQQQVTALYCHKTPWRRAAVSSTSTSWMFNPSPAYSSIAERVGRWIWHVVDARDMWCVESRAKCWS